MVDRNLYVSRHQVMGTVNSGITPVECVEWGQSTIGSFRVANLSSGVLRMSAMRQIRCPTISTDIIMPCFYYDEELLS